MLNKTTLPFVLLILCTAVLLVVCGNALSQVMIQMRGPLMFFRGI